MRSTSTAAVEAPKTVVPVPMPVTPPVTPPPTANSVTISPVEVQRETPVTLPSSKLLRLTAGASALLIPRSIGERLGLFHIGGGRNLWWVTDVDTIIFDAVLFAALFWTARSLRSASLRNPIFWLVTALTIMIGLPLIYVVTNFGTLFRMREMIYLGLMLIPLTLVSAPPKRDTALAVAGADNEAASLPDAVEGSSGE
jgi:hypothetical protein